MYKYLYLVIGILLLSGLFRSYLGFITMNSNYAIGYNIGTALMYVLGIVLVGLFIKEWNNKKEAINKK